MDNKINNINSQASNEEIIIKINEIIDEINTLNISNIGEALRKKLQEQISSNCEGSYL